MRIGLDYDGTITADPGFWQVFCASADARGHEVYIVTMRYESECNDMPYWCRAATEGIYATGRTAKAPFMFERGICIDVWIDDTPLAISKNAEEIWGVPSPEGVPIDPCNP